MDAELVRWLQRNPANVALWLIWGQTEEHRAAIAELEADGRAAAAGALRALEITERDTREATPVPVTARVLFPVWEREASMQDAVCAHLEAA